MAKRKGGVGTYAIGNGTAHSTFMSHPALLSGLQRSNIFSLQGLICPAYNASKAAVIQLGGTRSTPTTRMPDGVGMINGKTERGSGNVRDWQLSGLQRSNIFSLQGLICPAYNASKAAVIQLARNLAAEWGSGATVLFRPGETGKHVLLGPLVAAFGELDKQLLNKSTVAPLSSFSAMLAAS
jgi:hypothetical protein